MIAGLLGEHLASPRTALKTNQNTALEPKPAQRDESSPKEDFASFVAGDTGSKDAPQAPSEAVRRDAPAETGKSDHESSHTGHNPYIVSDELTPEIAQQAQVQENLLNTSKIAETQDVDASEARASGTEISAEVDTKTQPVPFSTTAPLETTPTGVSNDTVLANAPEIEPTEPRSAAQSDAETSSAELLRDARQTDPRAQTNALADAAPVDQNIKLNQASNIEPALRENDLKRSLSQTVDGEPSPRAENMLTDADIDPGRRATDPNLDLGRTPIRTESELGRSGTYADADPVRPGTDTNMDIGRLGTQVDIVEGELTRINMPDEAADTQLRATATAITGQPTTGSDPMSILRDGAVSGPEATLNVAPVTAPSTPTVAPTSGMTPVAPSIPIASPNDLTGVIMNAIQNGMDPQEQLIVQLDPPELGRIMIDFKFDAQGLQQITVTSENPEALKRLREMHAELTTALRDQGLSGENLSFQQETQDRPQSNWGAQARSENELVFAASDDQRQPPTSGAQEPTSATRTRLDLVL